MSNEEENTENLCTDIIKKEVDIKWKDEKMNKAWPYRALESSCMLLQDYLCVFYIFLYLHLKSALDLPYILKRGDFLFSENEQTGQQEDIIKCRD